MQHSVFLTCNFLQKVLAKNNNTNYTIYTERSSTNPERSSTQLKN